MCSKLVGALCVVGGGCACGVYYAMRCKRRVRELLELERILQYVAGELRYRHSILSEVFGRAASRSGQPFCDWLMQLCDTLEDSGAQAAGDIWTSSLQSLRASSCMSKDDFAVLEPVGATLGNVDLETQLREIEFVTELIREKRIHAGGELANRSRVAVAVSAVGAILIVILLV